MRNRIATTILVMAALLPAAPAWSQSDIRINAGGPAISSFAADGFFSGGHTFATASAISGTGAVPMEIFQSERSGNSFSYNLAGLQANTSYLVQLGFAELYWNTPGSRIFNVAVNGSTVLSNYDIFTKAGGINKAIIESVNATSTASGTLSINFTGTVDEA
ncbi:MAG: malectin domain-containing carbohydrate-binding protein, partial [Verrucomicrobiales bacterium]